MEYRYAVRETRWCEFGEGKEFETRFEALNYAKSMKSKIIQDFCVRSDWELDGKTEIIEENGKLQFKIPMKYALDFIS